MVDYHEINIKNVCCTCLNTERNLSQLCKVDDGVNDLFFLLSYKSEAYEAIFIKDMTQLYICWECIALLQRFTKFREQVCIAHSKLTDIIDGKVKYSNIKTLSKLSIGSQIGYDHVFGTNEEEPKMFLDCGPADIDIKYESDTDDEPLVQLRDLKTEISIDNDYDNDPFDGFDDPEIGKPKRYKREIKKTYIPIVKLENNIYESENLETKVKSEIDNDNSTIGFGNALNSEIGETMMEQKDIKKEVKNKNVQLKVNIPISNSYDKDMSKRKKNDGKNKGYVSNKAHIKVNKKVCINLIQMNKAERVRSIEERKSKLDYVNAMNKCEECIEIFENCDSLEKHIAELHEPKPNTKMCNICKVYVKLESLNLHMKMHYLEWKCQICKESLLYKFKCKENVKNHLKTKHYMQDAYIDAQMKILTEQEDRIVKNKELVKKCTQLEKLLTVLIDDPKGPGFPCLQCRQYFRSKNLRNKHVQKCHSEGFQCPTCGKKFPLKDTLRKHEMIHCNPRPRQPCQVCGKMVRVDLVRVHGLSHFSGKQYSCVPCDKTFNSPYSYQTHLKYSRQHAERAALKYKCSVCGKDYRSPGELRDHHNYAHESKTIHKCPICQTALATARGVKNHVKRAHEEKTIIRNKICQTCGKAFMHQKTLQEHELIHTGERPISCDMCGRAFRQRAGLYTHKRLVHKVPLKKKVIQHTDEITVVNTVINKNKD